MDVDKKTLVELFTRTLKVRLFEEKVWELFGENLVPGTLHLYLGQEAIAAGITTALKKSDWVQSTHRGHGHVVAKGADMNAALAELLGKSSGSCKGKGGSMYTVDVPLGFLYSSGIVSATIPVAVGVGLGIKLGKDDKVVLSFFGDGAANEGEFHECLNFASIWKLPVIFIVENNKYSITTSTKRSISVKNIAFRASGYNIPGCVVDGMDLLEVYLATKEAVERARNGDGPSLIEALTHRFHGHTRWDPAYGVYRSKEVLDWYKANDPIERTERFLLRINWISSEELETYRNESIELVENAVKFAVESPYPDVEEAYSHVYSDYEVYRG